MSLECTNLPLGVTKKLLDVIRIPQGVSDVSKKRERLFGIYRIPLELTRSH